LYLRNAPAKAPIDKNTIPSISLIIFICQLTISNFIHRGVINISLLKIII
jgi:hypothetical protein